MKKISLIIMMALLMLTTLTGCTTQEQETENFTIVTSFYPMYLIAENVAEGIDGIVVENMASQTVGCLHDYTLTTADLMKVEKADVFIINGLGIENFTSKIQETYHNLTVIEASRNIEGLIADENEENAHIWLDIEQYEKQVETIAKGLIALNPENREHYLQNANQYHQELESLKQEIKEETAVTKKCLSFSESLAYLQHSMNLEMKIIETDHEQNGLSAEVLAEAIEYVKENHIQNIILDKDTQDQNAQIVASETGAKIYRLDAGLTGRGEHNSYLTMMRENLEVVKQMEE